MVTAHVIEGGTTSTPTPGTCVYYVCMARLNVYVPDDLAERARRAGLNVSALAQAAIVAELDQLDTTAWLDALPRPAHRTSHEAALTALDAARGDFGSEGE